MRVYWGASLPALMVAIGGAAPGQSPALTRLDHIAAVRGVNLAAHNGGTSGRSTATVRLENVSTKAIYAFRLALSSRYRDGSVQVGHPFVDLLPEYVDAAGLPADFQRRIALFRSGEPFEHEWKLTPAANGEPTVLAEAAVDAIIFEDRTALGDAAGIRQILQLRALEAQVLASLAGDLDTVAGSADPMQALNARLAWLRKAQDDLRRVGPESYARRVPATVATVKDPMGKIVASKDTTVERVQMLDAFVRSVGGDPARIRATAEDQRKLARMYELHSTLAEAQR